MMKNTITKFFAAIALLAFMAPSMVGWAEEVTFNFAELASTNGWVNGTAYTPVEISPITLSALGGGNNGKYYTSDNSWRMYNGGTVNITAAEGYSITAVSSTPSQTFSISNGAASLSCTATIKFTEIVVTYSAGSAPATYSVTYNANGGTGAMVDDNSPYEENDEVSLLSNTFIAPEGMMWDSWEVKDADDNVITVNNGTFTMPASNVTVTAQWVVDPNAPQINWVLTSLADLTESDVFVIVGNNGSNYAITNDNGTGSAPATSTVTIANNQITSTVAANIQWTVSGDATNGYTFYPNGSTTTWLYCNTTAASSSNNNMRVGTGDRKVFELNSDNYLMTKDTYVVRYLSIYVNEGVAQDWRGYINTNLCPEMSFYKKVTGDVVPPSITANNVSIEYNATNGEIEYTINNEVEGGVLTAATESEWLTVGEVAATVPFTCTANEAGAARTATVTLTYTFNRETVTKDVTITQAAAPVVYSTIPALFEAATGTAASVLVTFDNWVVSGVSTNGKNVFVTDNNGNGFVIFDNEGGLGDTYAANDILAGTAVSCSLVLYHGFAELTGVNAADLTITDGGTVAESNIALADLAGVNTGALVSYENLVCSVDNSGDTPKYYLSDGTTQLQVYNALYAFDALTDGKTYNITGVYQQYNSVKEILPRSAEDIVEVISTEPSVTLENYTIEVPSTGDEGTLTVQYENIDEILAEIEFYNAAGEVVEASYYDEWFTADLDENNNVNYLVMENDGEARSAYFKVWAYDNDLNEVYSELITINQAAYVAPVTGDKYVKVTSNTDLTDGQYLIVYEEVGLAFDGSLETLDAVSNTIEVSISDENEIAVTDETTASEFTITATTDGYSIQSASGYYIGQTSDANGLASSPETAYENTISFEDNNADIVSSSAHLRYNSASNQARFRYYKSASYTGQKAIQLYKKVEATPVTETYTLNIDGYSTATNPDGGYYLIASPVIVNPASVEGMTDGNFDLYYFDQAEDNEWQNWKDNDATTGHFNLVPGKGYLYAHETGGAFELTGTPYTGNGVIELDYTEGPTFAGWNLVGNPFGADATITTTSGSEKPFYVMNEEGTDLAVSDIEQVAAMEGVFVVADAAGQTVTFTEVTEPTNTSKIVMNILSNRSNVIDRAIVRFGQGEQLPKFMLNPNNTKIYIPQYESNYAMVRSENEAEMPVSFKAATNGTYTISVNAENVDMDYMHLIDNLTGNDIDLRETPSYTFEANTTDNANRFTLVYGILTGVNENNENNFAYFNGSNWTISSNGNATLQVVDLTGRVLSSEQLNGTVNVNINQAAGVYMLRLVNGDNVMTQKVVVK